MIDVSQWRASIGLWHYCQVASSKPANGCQCHSFKGAVDSKSDNIISVEKTTKLPAAIPIVALLLLLYICFPLSRIDYTPPTDIITHCYWSQVQCNTDIYSLQSVVLPGATINLIILSIVRLLLLLLSGDVELNPGPTVDDKPDIPLLIQWLRPLVDWKQFGMCLPGMSVHDNIISKIEAEHAKIEDQKLALYSKWLSINSNATWRDVITTLTSLNENTLAQDIKEKINVSSAAAGTSVKKEIMFNTGNEEEKIFQELIELNKKFSSLMVKVRMVYNQKVATDPNLFTNLKTWAMHHINWEKTAASFDEFLTTIKPYYDFIDCSLIVDMSEEFLKGEELVRELQKYNEEANNLCSSTTVKYLNKALKEIYKDHIPDFKNMPQIILQLHNTWYDIKINKLESLIQHLLPTKLRQSLWHYITILSGSVVIKYTVFNIPADSLIEHAKGKLQFMRLIGIFSLYINDHAVLQEDENMNFTFELALLEAVTAGNNEAVEFLLQLETVNIDHTNEEGKTALMLACERGHEDIAHSLLSGGANVNLQDNNGKTALMRATSMIKTLLEANANPHQRMADSLSNSSSSTDISTDSGYSSEEVTKSEKQLTVSPSDLKDLILSREKEVKMTIFLVLIHGLPHSGKSDVFQKFLKKIPNASVAKPQHGLSFYQLAAVENAESGRLHMPSVMYSVTTSEDCYDVYAMTSAMRQIAIGKRIKYREDINEKSVKFGHNNDLNVHFDEIFSKLTEEESKRSSTLGSQGIAIFNVWDIDHSPTVNHFLPALHGLLYNSYSWVFFDLERDSRALYKPREASPMESGAYKNLMKYRHRLHNLMHYAKFNLPAEKKVCLLFATHGNKLTESERKRLVQSIKPDLENTATQIGVKEVIDFNVIPIKPDDDETCAQLIAEKLDRLVYKALKSTFTMPFSFIFLRSFYYKNDKMVYIKKNEIQKVADELKISEEELHEFCKLFTSFGSIIDVSLIDQKSEYVILKPNLFINELDKIFRMNDVANKGILTITAAENLFGSMNVACVYTNILISMKLAAKLNYENVEIDIPLDSKTVVFYLPEIRTTPFEKDTTKLRCSALQLHGRWNAPPDHFHTSFVTTFLSQNPHAKVCICDNTPTNVTKIEAIESSSETKVKFDVVYFGYTIEFRAETSSKEVFSHIIASCHELMKEHKNVQYNFAILCSKDPSSTNAKYGLTRERHLLPYNTLCDVCSNDKRYEDPILMVWNELLKEKPVSVERKLNEDPILLDDVYNIAKHMDKLDPNTIKQLALKLGIALDPKLMSKPGWAVPLAILMELEKKECGEPEVLSKSYFASKIAETANEIHSEEDKKKLCNVVHLLDDEILASISSDEKENITDEYVYQYPFEAVSKSDAELNDHSPAGSSSSSSTDLTSDPSDSGIESSRSSDNDAHEDQHQSDRKKEVPRKLQHQHPVEEATT